MSSQSQKSSQLQTPLRADSILSLFPGDTSQKPGAPHPGSKADPWSSARTYEHKARGAQRKLGFHSVD